MGGIGHGHWGVGWVWLGGFGLFEGGGWEVLVLVRFVDFVVKL